VAFCHRCGQEETVKNKVLSGDVFLGRGIESIQWHLCEECIEDGWAPIVITRTNALVYSWHNGMSIYRVFII